MNRRAGRRPVRFRVGERVRFVGPGPAREGHIVRADYPWNSYRVRWDRGDETGLGGNWLARVLPSETRLGADQVDQADALRPLAGEMYDEGLPPFGMGPGD